MDLVVDERGIVFIPINNLRNSCCYNVALVQLLHTSPMFNQLMLELSREIHKTKSENSSNLSTNSHNLSTNLSTKSENLSNLSSNSLNSFNSSNSSTKLNILNISPLIISLLKPSIIYSSVTVENYKEKYQEMKQSYSDLYSTYVNSYAFDGYSTHYLLYCYLLPSILRVCNSKNEWKSKFSVILEETGVDQIYLRQTSMFFDTVLTSSPFLKNEYNSEIKSMISDFISWGRSHELKSDVDQKGYIVEIYPNAHSVDGGHALFMLKKVLNGKNVFYIFDDDSTIDLFERYVQGRNQNISKISIHMRNNDEAIHQLQQLWGGNILTRRCNNRWELLNETTNGKEKRGEEMKRIASSFIEISNKFDKSNKFDTEQQMRGGSIRNFNSREFNRFNHFNHFECFNRFDNEPNNETKKSAFYHVGNIDSESERFQRLSKTMDNEGEQLYGGEPETGDYKTKFFIALGILVAVIIILIVDIIVGVKRNCAKPEKYGCPCQKNRR